MNIPLASERVTLPLWDDDKDAPCAARPLGINSRQTAYRLARNGELPIETISVGVHLMVRTADLRRLLGLDEQVSA